MEIVGKTAELPKRGGPMPGRLHPDVAEVIEGIKANDLAEGEYLEATFDNDKEATVRASTLRTQGYIAYTRGKSVFARVRTEADDAEDEAEA